MVQNILHNQLLSDKLVGRASFFLKHRLFPLIFVFLESGKLLFKSQIGAQILGNLRALVVLA